MTLNNRGMSIVSVMIAAGIMLVIMAATGQFIISQAKQIRALEDKISANNLIKVVAATTGNSTMCTKSLVTDIPNPQTYNHAAASQPYSTDPSVVVPASAGMPISIALGNGVIINETSNKNIDSFNLEVANFRLYDSVAAGQMNGLDLYKVNLAGAFARDLDGYQAATRGAIMSAFYVGVDPGSGNIQECFSSNGNDDSSLENICESLNGSFDPATSRCNLPTNPAVLNMFNPQTMCTALGFTWSGSSCIPPAAPPTPVVPPGPPPILTCAVPGECPGSTPSPMNNGDTCQVDCAENWQCVGGVTIAIGFQDCTP